MRIFLTTLYILGFCLLAQSQTKYTSSSAKAIKLYEEAKHSYGLYYHAEAESLFLKAIKADGNFAEAYFVLARMYVDLNRLEDAVENYKKGLEIDSSFYTYGFFYKGKAEIHLGRYQDALMSFYSLLKFEKENKKLIQHANRGVQQAKIAISLVENPVEFERIRLSSNVNSPDDEYWPSLSADEKTLMITRLVGSAVGNSMQEDFYVSDFKGNNWTLARNAGRPLNTYDNEGAQSISANGNFMVYTVCNRSGVIGRCDIYYSEKKGDLWLEPKNLGSPVNSKSKETQPSLSADGRAIYFSSDRGGGKGGMDIWVSYRKDDNQWTNPINLGDSVNTIGNEFSPFIHHDNNTLYFSSDYHFGLGGADIFYCRRKSDDSWGSARNIGYPINTSMDEIGLIVTAKGNRAYYSSDINSNSGRDIFYFNLYKEARPDEVSYLKGKVFESGTNKVLKADFELYDLSNGKLMSKSYSDPYKGTFLVCLPTNRNYMLNVSKEGYLFYSENFSFEGIHQIEEPFYKDIPLSPILAGKSIVLRNIFFDTDSYKLKPQSYYELDKLVRLLTLNMGVKAEISGHTDNVGTKEYNYKLSHNRAKSVVSYLVQKGINADRLFSKGYGFDVPISSNDTDEGKALNRRTELKIIE